MSTREKVGFIRVSELYWSLYAEAIRGELSEKGRIIKESRSASPDGIQTGMNIFLTHVDFSPVDPETDGYPRYEPDIVPLEDGSVFIGPMVPAGGFAAQRG